MQYFTVGAEAPTVPLFMTQNDALCVAVGTQRQLYKYEPVALSRRVLEVMLQQIVN